tara:strand:- start:510 stop:776 length:267 start_codon:yes stop_codon:yes gene_type:complete
MTTTTTDPEDLDICIKWDVRIVRHIETGYRIGYLLVNKRNGRIATMTDWGFRKVGLEDGKKFFADDADAAIARLLARPQTSDILAGAE